MGISVGCASKIREEKLGEIKYDGPRLILVPRPCSPFLLPHKNMSAPEPESFGFQAEISQLLDLIIS